MTPPGEKRRVVLRLPATGDTMSARLEEADGELLTLVLDAATGQVLRGEPSLIEYTSAQGVHRVPAAIVFSDGAQDEVLRVRPDGPERVVQRRDFLRVDAFLAVRARVVGDFDADGLQTVHGVLRTTTLNVSAGGMLLKDLFDLRPGTELELEVELGQGQSGPPACARGRVVREVTPDVKGVMIESMASTDRERLVRYVTVRERETLKRIARDR